MKLLCCDTSTDYGVFAVSDDGAVLASATALLKRDLSVRFFGVMDGVLAEARLTFGDIDVLAVGIGPGSFTGVRVAVTTFRTLAQASGKRLVGVGGLEAMAYGIVAAKPEAAVLTLLPSRRGEVYAAVYGREFREPFPAVLDELEPLAAEIGQSGVVIVCGPDSAVPSTLNPYPRIDAASPPAEALAVLALREAAAGRFADPLSLAPLYVVAPAINQHLDPHTVSRKRAASVK